MTGTFNDTLANAGYNVSIFGKTHIGADVLAEGPPGFDPVDHFYGTLLRGAHILKPAGGWLTSGGKVVNESDPLPPWRYNGKTNKDPNTLRACINTLKTLPNREAGRVGSSSVPQLLHCSFFSPHPPFDTNSSFLSKIDKSKVLLPPQASDKAAMHPADIFTSTSKMHLNYTVYNNQSGNITEKNVAVEYTDEQLMKVREVYYAMGNELDRWIGQIIDALHDRNDADTWYVIYLSDHGENQMEHRQTGKNNMYEGSARVPFTIYGPGIRSGVVDAEHFVSLLDLYPTLCDLANVPKPSFLSGKSLSPLLFENGNVFDSAFNHVIGQYHSTFSATGTFMVRQGDYKLILFGDDSQTNFPPQLFNLDEDPYEMNNLLEDGNVSAHIVSVQKEMTALLDSHMDWQSVDKRARAFQRDVFVRMAYETNEKGWSKPGACTKQLNSSVFHDFDFLDASKIEHWASKPCT